MRRAWSIVLLLTVAACGGGSSDPVAGCTVLGQGPALALSGGDRLQIQMEVKFLEVSDAFLEQVGLDFRTVLPTTQETSPGFGGRFQERPTYATPAGVAGGVLGTDVIVPQGHRPGSYLPGGHLGSAPGLGQATAFLQAPGEDDQCLDVADLARFPLTSAGAQVPATTAIVPTGELAPGVGVAIQFLDAAQLDALIQAISMTSGEEFLAAPQIAVFDGQRAMALAQTVQVPASDLLPVVTDEVYGGQPLSTVFSGVTLDVRPTIAPGGGMIRLQVRPTSHGIVGTVGGTHQVGINPIVVRSPVLVPAMVSTTVSVPDGGTIVLGGLKNLTDDGMAGVPLLSRIPYVNRLFKNTSTAATQPGLMLLVTPRILIQEEE